MAIFRRCFALVHHGAMPASPPGGAGHRALRLRTDPRRGGGQRGQPHRGVGAADEGRLGLGGRGNGAMGHRWLVVVGWDKYEPKNL